MQQIDVLRLFLDNLPAAASGAAAVLFSPLGLLLLVLAVLRLLFEVAGTGVGPGRLRSPRRRHRRRNFRW